MKTEQIIRQLQYVSKKHENDLLLTGSTNITYMCNDVISVLEKYQKFEEEVIKLNNNIESLIDVAHSTHINCEDETEKVRLDGQIRAYWTVKGLVEDILADNQ